MTTDLDAPLTLEQAKKQSDDIAAYSKSIGAPCAMEVVVNSKKQYQVQPSGMHVLFKSHKLVHTSPTI